MGKQDLELISGILDRAGELSCVDVTELTPEQRSMVWVADKLLCDILTEIEVEKRLRE